MTTKATKNYRSEAFDDAKEAAEYFIDEILERFCDTGKVKTRIGDYSDCYVHESITDRSYSLREACSIIEDLDEFEETDSGLWEGKDIRESLCACAAYTYGNAVNSIFSDIMERINENEDVAELYEMLSEDCQECEGVGCNYCDDPDVRDKSHENVKSRIKEVILQTIGSD